MEIRTLEIAGMASVLQALRLPFSKECRSGCDVYMTANTDYDPPMLSTESRCIIDDRDMKLLSVLVKRGDEHSKALRGLIVYAEINAPLMLWSELDTYRIGTERLSSESTMHTIGNGGLTMRNFDLPDVLDETHDHENKGECSDLFSLAKHHKETVERINDLAALYNESKKIEVLLEIKRMLPTSYMQKRIQYFSYPTLRRIWIQRHNHRLPHWHRFCEWIETLPFFDMLIMPDKDNYIDNDKTNRNG